MLTQLYFFAWYDRFYTSARLTSTALFAALFFVQFSTLTTIRSRRTGTLFPEQVVLSLVNAFVLVLVLRELLWPEYRWVLAASTLALAVVYLVSARAVSSADGAGTLQARLLFAGLALTSVTLAIPMALDGRSITIAWAVEAAVLVWTGFTARLWYLRAAALVLFALVGMRLVMFPIEATVFLWNARFGLALVTAASAGVAVACAWRWRAELSTEERPAFGALAVGINVLLVSALTAEVALYFHPSTYVTGFERDSRLAESLTVSLLWTAYATALLTVGVRFSSALLRWQGLALFAIVTLKVFVADLSFLRGFYRIISSIALGVVLIVDLVPVSAEARGRARDRGPVRSATTGSMRALVLFLLGAGCLQAQGADWNHWQYAAPVNVSAGASSRLVAVLVPDQVTARARSGWPDLRVVDADGREVPFVLHARHGARALERRPSRLLEPSVVPGQYSQAIADIGADSRVHNAVTLGLEGDDDLLSWVEVAMSSDLTTWRVVRERAPIYRLNRDGMGAQMVVTYADSPSRYIRVRVLDASKPHRITTIDVAHEVVTAAERVAANVALTRVQDTPRQSTWTSAAAATAPPISEVRFSTSQEAFYRPVRVETSDDGQAWTWVASGEIFRMIEGGLPRASLSLTFAESPARRWRITVLDRDDKPLADLTPELYAVPRRVVFRYETGKQYRLLYGNTRAVVPQYDLSRLTDASALESAESAGLGAEATNPDYADPAPWTERNRGILWVALAGAVLVLGSLAVRALRSAS